MKTNLHIFQWVQETLYERHRVIAGRETEFLDTVVGIKYK